MIPEFNDDGYLPPGVFAATVEEIAARFGQESELRRVQMQSLNWLIDLVKKTGGRRLIVNGSFVTDLMEPNDIDCVLLIGPDFPFDASAYEELRAGLPYISLSVAGQVDFDLLVEKFFASDRLAIPKGMIEVVL